MPSQVFQELALSQLELLANSLILPGRTNISKIKSMALYLPQENVQTGQLEFLPAILYPHPRTERVFIASEADSGVAPTLPHTLTKLPGFAHATSLLPTYPMVNSGSEAGVGVVEEVLCDLRSTSGAAALSVPLFAGSQTVGVLLVSPNVSAHNGESVWTLQDREQVSRAAKSLSLALSMDSERASLQAQNEQIARALSDNLHQVKNPLQALRTYGKLLQRQIADSDHTTGMTAQLLELAEHLMVQSDRIVDRLKPVDKLVNALGSKAPPALNPAKSKADKALARWRTPLLPWSDTEKKTNSPADTSLVTNFRRNSIHESTVDTNTPTSSIVANAKLEMTFVMDVLDPILAGFKAISLDKGIKFIVEQSDELPGVCIIPEALQEAFTNIVDNAFKYVFLPKPFSNDTANLSPMVRVKIFPNQSNKKGVTISVEDNGPGIPPLEYKTIFERGVRSVYTQSVEGTGIGLAIAKSLLEGMGGTLTTRKPSDIPNSLGGAYMEIALYRKPAFKG